MAITLIQCGDLHLDGAFERLSPEKAVAQRKAGRNRLGEIAALAKENRADLLLCTGDLFDGPNPYYETLEAAASAFAQAEIPVFIAPGNHDWFDAASPYASIEWSGNVHIFRSLTPETVELPGINCTVTGIGYPTRRPENPNFAPKAPDGGGIHLFVGHGDFGKPGEYLSLSEEAAKHSGFAYIALGHAHGFSAQQAGKTLVVQNGSVAASGFDEPGEKGVVLAKIDENGATAAQIPLQGSRCVSVAVDITPFDGEALVSAILAEAEKHAETPEQTFLRLRLLGQGEIRPEKLRAKLSHFLALRLQNDTFPKTSPFAKAEEDSLAGLFVRHMRDKYDQAPENEKETVLMALSFGLAALENRDILPNR